MANNLYTSFSAFLLSYDDTHRIPTLLFPPRRYTIMWTIIQQTQRNDTTDSIKTKETCPIVDSRRHDHVVQPLGYETVVVPRHVVLPFKAIQHSTIGYHAIPQRTSKLATISYYCKDPVAGYPPTHQRGQHVYICLSSMLFLSLWQPRGKGRCGNRDKKLCVLVIIVDRVCFVSTLL